MDAVVAGFEERAGDAVLAGLGRDERNGEGIAGFHARVPPEVLARARVGPVLGLGGADDAEDLERLAFEGAVHARDHVFGHGPHDGVGRADGLEPIGGPGLGVPVGDDGQVDLALGGPVP